MQITAKQSKGLNVLFEMDIHLINFYFDKEKQFYLDQNNIDGLISKFCKENSIELKFIKQLIFNLILQNKVKYISYLDINGPCYKDYIKIYFYIDQEIDLTSLSLGGPNR